MRPQRPKEKAALAATLLVGAVLLLPGCGGAVAEGAAFVIATHDSRLTRRCDRVVALLDGRIQ